MLSTSQSVRPLNSNQARGGFLGLFGRRDVGDTIDKAKDIGTIKRGGVFKASGDVGGKDLDFFKFKSDVPLSFSARLDNNSSKRDKDPVTLTFVDKSGKAIMGTDGKGLMQTIKAGKTNTVTSTLAAGTYYIRLESTAGKDQNYKLRLSTAE
jgi:hypothetical protein